MKIIIFGATGLLGKEMVRRFSNDDVTPLGSKDVAVEDNDAVNRIIHENIPDVVINCAAIANPEICEKDPDLAYRVNSIGAGNIAAACQDIGSKYVYISTDHIFDGYKGGPYTEFDEPCPVNTYGRSKLAGEKFTANLCNRYFIIRTSILFGIHRDTFVTKSIREAKELKKVAAPSDQMVSPTYVKDLAYMIRELVEKNAYGIYHLTNKGVCSRYDLAKKALCIAGYDEVEVIPVLSDFTGKAQRPLNVALDNYRVKLMGHICARSWEEALEDFITNEC